MCLRFMGKYIFCYRMNQRFPKMLNFYYRSALRARNRFCDVRFHVGLVGISLFSIHRLYQTQSTANFQTTVPTPNHHTGQRLPKKYFVSTPIFYVNAVPHIGHLYSAVLADVVSRWYQIRGVPVIFCTGTDEHGLKVQQAAARSRQDPRNFCSEISEHFKKLFEAADIRYTDYIRTTEERHIIAVQRLWRTLQEKGHIYRGTYEGWYSVSDECFLPDGHVTDSVDKDGKPVKISSESGNQVEWTKEENYMFRLSSFSHQLTSWLDQKVIKPVHFEPIVRRWIEDGLSDLSVSRQRDKLHWGIPVPDDDTQTIYVWLDALTNYLTVGGYPKINHTWPADCHIIGKDILKFHAIYWPAFLMAADLEPPRTILCHSHWMIEAQKMSKSVGNVVDPFDRIERYSADGVRYFLLREGVPHSDGNYSDQKVIECINSELVNTLGNLLSRCASYTLNPQQQFPHFNSDVFEREASDKDKLMWQNLRKLPDVVDYHYRDYHVYRALDAIVTQLHQTNAFVQTHKPWQLRKEPDALLWLHTVLHVTMETLRVVGILLQPVTPSLSDKLLNRLNIGNKDRKWEHIFQAKTETTALGMDTGVLLTRLKS